MKKRKWLHSLRYRIIITMAASLLLTCGIIIGYNMYIYRIMDRQMTQTISNMLALYTEEVSYALDNTEAFLTKNCLNQDTIQKIRKPRESMDRYLALSEMHTLFEASIDSYTMDGLFLYDKQSTSYIGETKLDGDPDYNRLINGSMSGLIREFEASADDRNNEWFSYQIRGEYFLVKMFDVQNVYIGSWIHTNTILEKLQKITEGKDDHLLMLDAERKVLLHDFPAETIHASETAITLNGVNYKILRSEKESHAFSFLVLQSKKSFWKNSSGIGMLISVTCIIIAVLCFTFVIMQKRFFGKPIQQLVDAMNQLKDGNLQVRLQDENVFDEFRVVNDTFDRMIKDIEKLKIDVYEEKLNKQHTELLYLQEQINPHFLTNCMNLIRSLSVMGENDKVQKAAVLVSNHMRYALACSTQVPLERELTHVANYEKLQKMRYGNEFTLSVNTRENLRHCKIPTMLIQVFVENAIKHELDPDKQLSIQIRIWDDCGKWMNIHIQDSGDGFAPETLQHLNASEKLINSDGEHVGIYNVCQRLHILYGEQASIQFSNGDACGAQIDIRLPLQS